MNTGIHIDKNICVHIYIYISIYIYIYTYFSGTSRWAQAMYGAMMGNPAMGAMNPYMQQQLAAQQAQAAAYAAYHQQMQQQQQQRLGWA